MQTLNVAEVAALLDLPERTVRQQAGEGKFGALEYGHGRGGDGGRQIQIPLHQLPAAAQIAHFRAVIESQRKPANIGGLTDDQKRALGQKLEILAAWQAFRESRRGLAPARQLDRQFVALWREVHPGSKLSMPTLHRWAKIRRERGEDGLVDRRGKGRQGESDIPEDVWVRYRTLYLDPRRRSHMQCYNTVRDMALLEGRDRQVPSESAFRRRAAREFTKEQLVFHREGSKVWYLKVAPYIERDHRSVPPGGLYVMDHFQLDFAVVTEDGRVIRPWLSAMADFRTRRYVGWALTDRPCQESTLAAWRMAAENPEIGTSDAVLLDNGREYTGYSFAGRGHRKTSQQLRHQVTFNEAYVRSLVEHLGVVTIFSIPENPTSKGDLERSFRELHESFCKAFESYLGNKPENRPEWAEAIRQDTANLPTMAEVFPVLSEFITYYVNERPHHAPDMDSKSPRQVWEEEICKRPVRRVDKDVLAMLCMPYAAGRPLTIQKGGIRVWGRRYWSDTLQDHLGEKVTVRYDQADPKTVYVFKSDGSYLDKPALQTPVPVLGDPDGIREGQANRARRKKRLTAERRDLQSHSLSSTEILGARIEAGKQRQAVERAEKGRQPAQNVVAITPVAPELRQAAKDVARAKLADSDQAETPAAGYTREQIEAMMRQQARVVGGGPGDRTAEIYQQMDEWVKSGMKRQPEGGQRPWLVR